MTAAEYIRSFECELRFVTERVQHVEEAAMYQREIERCERAVALVEKDLKAETHRGRADDMRESCRTRGASCFLTDHDMEYGMYDSSSRRAV